MEVDVVSLCPEFPNDNPALHGGVTWLCLDVTGAAVPVRERAAPAPMPMPAVQAEAAASEPVSEAEMAAEIAQISEALALAIAPERAPPRLALVVAPEPDVEPEVEMAAAPDEVAAEPASVSVAELLAPFELEKVPAARLSGIVPAGQDLHLDDDDGDILVEELPPLDAACLEGAQDAIEAIEAIEAAEASGIAEAAEAVAIGESGSDAPAPVAASSTSLPPAPDDPFTVLVTTLADVAVGAGSPHVAALLPELLLQGRLAEALPVDVAQALADADVVRGTRVTDAFAAQTRAWRAILGGTSDDFSACGSAMLDEWAADLLARLLGEPKRAAGLRRELREHGVAAFGLVEAA